MASEIIDSKLPRNQQGICHRRHSPSCNRTGISILLLRASECQEGSRGQISQIHKDNQPEQQVVSILKILI